MKRMLLGLLFGSVLVAGNGLAADKKIVFVAGRPSHGPGEHEHRAGCLLLKSCLDNPARTISTAEESMTERKIVTLPVLFKKVADDEPITWLTCYDYPTAYLQEQAGLDMILVGDSLGMTMLGYEATLPVTMEDMIRHAQAVRRGSANVLLIGDMPYMSYQPSIETAIRNAGRFMAEAACDGIKLEGGAEMADRIRAIVRAGIPAMGHLGLTPQSASALGGYRVQGRGARQAKKIIDDAKALEEAGAFAILLEMVPDRVCKLITVSGVDHGGGRAPPRHG